MEKYDFFHSDRMLRKNPRAMMIDKFILRNFYLFLLNNIKNIYNI